MHSGANFCGVSLRNPAAHRMQLMNFLRQDVAVDAATGWAAHSASQ